MTNEFHLKRKLGIGGSDAGSIFGMSNYKSLVQLYLEKATDFVPTFTEEQQKVLTRGKELEPLLKPLFEKKFGLKLNCNLPQLHHPQNPFIIGNVDGEIVDGNAMIEFKTNMTFSKSYFGEELTDQIPKTYLLQVHHYLMLNEQYTCAYVPIFTADTATFQILQNCIKKYGVDESILNDVDYSFKTYVVQKNEAHERLAKIMIEKYSFFWNEHVLKKIPPTVKSLEDIELLFPTSDLKKAILYEEEDLSIIDSIKEKQALIKQLDLEIDANKLLLGAKMEDAYAIVDKLGKVLCSYKNVSRKNFDIKTFRKEHEQLAEQYYNVSNSRSLKIH